MKGWLTCLHEYVLTLKLNMSEAQRVSPQDRFLFFWWIRGRGGGENVGILSSPYHLNFFFSLPLDTMVTGPGLQLQGHETGMIPKQETIYFYVRIPKGLLGQDMPSPNLGKLGLTVNAAILPGDKDSSPV